jgi:hypothetical protein
MNGCFFLRSSTVVKASWGLKGMNWLPIIDKVNAHLCFLEIWLQLFHNKYNFLWRIPVSIQVYFDPFFTQGNSEVFQACVTQLTTEQQQALHEVLSGANWPSSLVRKPALETTSDNKVAGAMKTCQQRILFVKQLPIHVASCIVLQ